MSRRARRYRDARLDRLLGELPGDDEATLAHDEREHEDMSRPPGW